MSAAAEASSWSAVVPICCSSTAALLRSEAACDISISANLTFSAAMVLCVSLEAVQRPSRELSFLSTFKKCPTVFRFCVIQKVLKRR